MHEVETANAFGLALVAVNLALQHWLSMRNSIFFSLRSSHEAIEEMEEDLTTVEIYAISCITASAHGMRRQKNVAVGIWYVKPHSIHFWRTFYQFREGDDLRFEENLRIPRACFDLVCALVSQELQQRPIPQQIREDVPTRSLSVRKKVAISLHLLGVGGPLHNMANLYGVGQFTVCQVLRQFVYALLKHKQSIICWPRTPQGWQALNDSFEEKQGIPNCCGAIDATHINMELPIDSNMRFLDVMCGMPGMCNDIRLLRNSSIYTSAQSNAIFNGPAITFGRHQLREFIIGDGGYLNLPWLVIPFPVIANEAQQQTFNYKLSSTHIIVERTFGHLKKMWGYLLQRVRNPDVQFLPKLIVACCILHNICVDLGVQGTTVADDEVLLDDSTIAPTPQVLRGCTRDVLFEYMRISGLL
ncbi:hypothetical protein GOP47_0004820 [Adiantum capillus-veneris]|uniref:DDE Tnp4 domain-containing protein n=1 Tax=Adiantum capillus-veneris TaxID=13818 RepID=A0A9D4V4R5_ADICA|nr:hypothetical protein GOP47_0004820 [Adiantum capillus-veneris]